MASCKGNCNDHYNLSEGNKYEKNTTVPVPDILNGVRNMDMSLNVDYETGRQIEIEGGMELPDFDDWLEDMVGGGQGQHPEEVQDDHQQV